MSTAFSTTETPVLNIVSVDYIRLATWDFKAYCDLSAIIRRRYVGWRKSRWLQYTMQRSQDGVSYGLGTQNEKGHGIFESSGAAAHEFYHWLTTTQETFLPSLYATRIDLQCTKARHKDQDYVKLHKSLRKPCELHLGNEGNTLYIGSRESNSFWRIYDKTPKHVRVEVELKAAQAAKVWSALQRGVMPATYFNSVLHNSRVPNVLVQYYGDSTDIVDLAEFLKTAPPDMNRKLQWLQTLDSLVYKLCNDHDTGDRTKALIVRWYDYANKH